MEGTCAWTGLGPNSERFWDQGSVAPLQGVLVTMRSPTQSPRGPMSPTSALSPALDAYVVHPDADLWADPVQAADSESAEEDIVNELGEEVSKMDVKDPELLRATRASAALRCFGRVLHKNFSGDAYHASFQTETWYERPFQNTFHMP